MILHEQFACANQAWIDRLLTLYRYGTIRSVLIGASRGAGSGDRYTVTARARIHCALLNTSGLHGRVDGGIGFSVDEPRWEVRVSREVEEEDSSLPEEMNIAIRNAVSKIHCAWQIPPFGVRVTKQVAPHTGLGSKTSLLLAIGRGAAMLDGRRASAVSVAELLGRGGTSGIGVHCFNHGGLVWDAGRAFDEKGRFVPSSAGAAPPPRLIVRVPVHWLSVVHFRFSASGLHGDQERFAFASSCPTPETGTVESLVAVSSLILPGILEHRQEPLQRGLGILQNTGFKEIEWNYQDSLTKRFRTYWTALKMPEALCLSSFGPTMYVLTTNPNRVVAKIGAFGELPVHIKVTKIRNVGCQVRKEIRQADGHISSVLESKNTGSLSNSGAVTQTLKRSGIALVNG
jgi:beta-ribofuranosylaminobenzene 5'-phosphate synthase